MEENLILLILWLLKENKQTNRNLYNLFDSIGTFAFLVTKFIVLSSSAASSLQSFELEPEIQEAGDMDVVEAVDKIEKEPISVSGVIPGISTQVPQSLAPHLNLEH